MNPPHIPGNEPDTSDMSLEPGVDGQPLHPVHGDPLIAEEDEAAKLGDFA